MNDQVSPDKDVDLLTAMLARRDVACPICGYNLRHATSDRCPECGARLELRVNSTDLRLGPWLTIVICLALLIGVGVFVTTIAAAEAIDKGTSGAIRMATVFSIATGVLGALLTTAVIMRRAFLRRPSMLQNAFSASIIIFCAALIVTLWAVMR